MAAWVDCCESVWIDSSLSAILVTGFTALAMIQCRQPVRRRTWGRLGLAASLCLIPLTWLDILPRVDLRHPSSITRTVTVSPEPVRRAQTNSVAPAATQVYPPSSPDSQVSGFSTASVWHLVFAFYCTVVSFGLARLVLGVVGTGLLIRKADQASSQAQEILADLPFEHGGHDRPQLLVSPRVGRPVLVGFFWPTILIPPEFDRPEAAASLRLGLLHELAHAEVGDYRYGILSAATQAVWFFLPQVWWVRSQLRLDAEFLADHRAVGHFGTSYHYAESLIGLAMDPLSAEQPADRAPTMANSAAAPRSGGLASALIQRVQMLLKCPFEVEDRVPRRWVVMASAFMLLWTLAATCLSVQDGYHRQDEVSWKSIDEAEFALRLAELVIAPQMLENRIFNLQFRLPARFRLACEVFAEPADLAQMEIVEYCLELPRSLPAIEPSSLESGWRQVEIIRDEQGREEVRVDGRLAVANHYPARPAQWLTIRPIPGRMTRLRDLELTW